LCVRCLFSQFAILRAEHDAANSACPSAGSLGSLHYLIFLVIYVAVGLVSSVQLMRIFRWLSWRKQWLAMTQYSLITAVCFFRALNHAVYYTLYQDLSFTVQTVISGLPYLFVSWSVDAGDACHIYMTSLCCQLCVFSLGCTVLCFLLHCDFA